MAPSSKRGRAAPSQRRQHTDILLPLLKRFCPKNVPKTGHRYGGKYNLKALLDARKGNWRSGSRITVRVVNPKRYFQELSWFRSWISAKGKWNVDVYDARGHNLHHEQFKDEMSELFATQVQQLPEHAKAENIFILDDFPRDSTEQLRTLRALKRRRLEMTRMYVANPGPKQVEAAHRDGAFALRMTLEKALTKPWAGVSSCAAYLDTCSGSSSYIETLMSQVLKNATHDYRLAVTILGRTSQPTDVHTPCRCIVTRMNALDAFLVGKGFRKIGACDRDSVFAYSGQNRVVTMFYMRGD